MARVRRSSVSSKRPEILCFRVTPSKHSMAMKRGLHVRLRRRLYKCWDDSVSRLLGPRGETGLGLGDFEKVLREGTSERQHGPVEYPRPCKPPPCPRHRVFPRCGNEKSSSQEKDWRLP